MKLLLDTHVLIWAAKELLNREARDALESGADAVVVSAASIWEIEIKRALGRLRVPDAVAQLVDESGYERLPITFEHASAAGRLPMHHRDPFDRMLIAQARLEGLTLATADEKLGAYGAPILTVERS